MRIDYPEEIHMPQLRELWFEAFADGDRFLDDFFQHGFAPDRCRCLFQEDRVAAVLYWFDCRREDQPLAYLYGVATRKAMQKRGLCRALMDNTHVHLKSLGYTGCILVPASGKLTHMYETMGYRVCSQVREFSCDPGAMPVNLRVVDAESYCQRRRQLLPPGGVIQEGENLDFLQTQATLYAGEDFLLAGHIRENRLYCTELLGNSDAAPGILRALNLTQGRFRTPGPGQDFAMYHALADSPAPTYFGLAFD